jgi:hypothetical protein
MAHYNGLTEEERARKTEIQDMLIERYVELREVLEEGKKARARAIEPEIKELQREIESIEEWANVCPHLGRLPEMRCRSGGAVSASGPRNKIP